MLPRKLNYFKYECFYYLFYLFIIQLHMSLLTRPLFYQYWINLNHILLDHFSTVTDCFALQPLRYYLIVASVKLTPAVYGQKIGVQPGQETVQTKQQDTLILEVSLESPISQMYVFGLKEEASVPRKTTETSSKLEPGRKTLNHHASHNSDQD